jgi:hypothetical protein
LADSILTARAITKLERGGNVFLHDADGVIRLRVDGFVAQKFESAQFDAVVEELREVGWYTRTRRSYANGDYAMCAQYQLDDEA